MGDFTIEKEMVSTVLKPAEKEHKEDNLKDNFNVKQKLPTVHYENSMSLSKDLQLLASMPELYDVHFVVGKTKQPVGAVKAILAARSRVFYKMLGYTQHNRSSSTDLESHHLSSSKKFSKRQAKFSLKRDASLKVDSRAGSGPMSATVIPIEEFEAEEFSHLMEYLHYGTCCLEARYIVGLMAAAEYANLDDLRQACSNFIERTLSIDTVCHFLCSAESHIQFKSTKSLIPKLLDFVSEKAHEVLSLPAFQALPQHVVRLILSRANLKASELTKFNAALTWSRMYCEKGQKEALKEVMEPLVECIAFQNIPTIHLMQEIRELGVVPDHTLMKALAYQADPTSVDVTPEPRRTSTKCELDSPKLNNLRVSSSNGAVDDNVKSINKT